MRRSGARGYTLLEVIVSLTVFGAFLIILTVLTAEMKNYEKRLPVNFMRHPQVSAVLSRLRKDVLDAALFEPYPESQQSYTQTSKTLIIRSYQDDGGLQTIVWDFSKPTEARRISWNVGVPREWIARGLPAELSSLKINAIELDEAASGPGGLPSRPYAVRVVATDEGGRIAIDQLYQPRAYE